MTFEEFFPVYEQLSKEKEVGTKADFLEGLRVFDKDESGKITSAELRHVMLALGKIYTKLPHNQNDFLIYPFKGERLTIEDVEEVMQGVDDGEGFVNYKCE